MRVGRCPQPPLLAVAPAARPERLFAAHGRHVDVWQLGAALSRTEQVRPEPVCGEGGGAGCACSCAGNQLPIGSMYVIRACLLGSLSLHCVAGSSRDLARNDLAHAAPGRQYQRVQHTI